MIIIYNLTIKKKKKKKKTFLINVHLMLKMVCCIHMYYCKKYDFHLNERIRYITTLWNDLFSSDSIKKVMKYDLQ